MAQTQCDVGWNPDKWTDTWVLHFLLIMKNESWSLWHPIYSMHDEHYRKSRVQQSPTDTMTEPVKLSRAQDDPYHPKKSTSNKEEVL